MVGDCVIFLTYILLLLFGFSFFPGLQLEVDFEFAPDSALPLFNVATRFSAVHFVLSYHTRHQSTEQCNFRKYLARCFGLVLVSFLAICAEIGKKLPARKLDIDSGDRLNQKNPSNPANRIENEDFQSRKWKRCTMKSNQLWLHSILKLDWIPIGPSSTLTELIER